MFPLRDENPTLHASLVTYLIIAVNVAVWVLVQGMGFGSTLARSVCEFGLIPADLLGRLPAGTRIALGGGVQCVSDGNPAWHTLLTSMFMHGGWLHLIGNMWFLSIFGDNVEDVMGPVKFAAFYLVCGIAAAAAQILSHPGATVPMVGASGAIGGVMGAYAVLFPRAPVHMLVFFGFFFTRIVVPAFVVLGYWFAIQFASGLVPSAGGGVAFWAHVGGFVAGVVIVRFLCTTERLEICRSRRGRTSRLVRRWR